MSKKDDKKDVRARCSNWTYDMKELLKNLVTPKIDIVDSKQNSSQYIKFKQDAWNTIEKGMKAAGYNLTVQRLKEQWGIIKMQARANISTFNKEQRQTGGGNPPKEPSEFDYEVANVASLDFENDEAQFDSDSINKTVPSQDQVKSQDIANTTFIVASPSNADLEVPLASKKRPTTIKDFTSYKRRRTATAATGDEMISNRISQINQEKLNNVELHTLKCKYEKDRHVKEMAIKEIELEIKNAELKIIEMKLKNIAI